MPDLNRKGTLTGTSLVISMDGVDVPRTVTLKYAAFTTQKIEISCDGGTEYFEPAYASSTATQKVATLGAPVSHIKFTGVVGNTWSVR